MKPIIALTSAALVAASLTACSSGGTTSKKDTGSSPASASATQEAAETTSAAPSPVSLDGTWQSEPDEENNFQVATIKGDTITIDFASTDDSEKSLYWAGTVEAQSGGSWTSKADKGQLENAITGSQDSEKVFTMKDGKLTYELTVMGSKRTMELAKQ